MNLTPSSSRITCAPRRVLLRGLVILLLVSPAADASPVIEADQAAAEILRDSDIVLLDARTANDRAHIRLQGSRYAAYRAWQDRNRRDPRGADFRSLWQADLAHLGIGPDTRVIIYGGRGSYNAPATVWYALQAVGVAGAAVVDGGFEALAAALPASRLDWDPESFGPDAPAPAREGVRALVSDAVYCPQIRKEDVLAGLSGDGPLLLDARSRAEYAGHGDRRNVRPGRIPGAVNLPHGLLRRETGSIRRPDEIRKLLGDLLGEYSGPLTANHGGAAEDPNDPQDRDDIGMIVYCQGGGRSAFLALALVHAGFRGVGNYFGSFGEWSHDRDCPVEAGPVGSAERTTP